MTRNKISGTRLEVAVYGFLAVALTAGALILSDVVLAVGAALVALALFGALAARSRERRDRDEEPEA